ncbi:G-type lectin S-receptor-like Serine/Threonine-kinase [Rhynchospora pubera]|uniref:non-specific serine/threonine protein kinase n=1 Tax=Rhynchospora pubera TaxID=906938 RepID=A0AAV8HLJ2_9POAL|nr:G-type lectin S-receptor-like Serine/Threonine-kinase [Rhynchospora pubera]
MKICNSKQQQPAAILFLSLVCLVVATAIAADQPATKEIQRGFSAKHDDSYSLFQSLLSDPTGVFVLGFLRIDSNLLDLAVIHMPSSFPLWRAMPANPAPWTGSISLSFDGNLVLSDQKKGTVFWSTASDGTGDRVVLLNSSNLQIQKTGTPDSIPWQSFDFPSNTIVENQNFTSHSKLLSTNQQFSMSLGANYFGLYIEFGKGSKSGIYLKHTALEAKAQIVPDGGPIYARIGSDGFLGMYQKEGPPADVLSFDTFNRNYDVFYRMTMEDDANLRAYYWNNTAWILDYTAITEPCSLPTTCGSYSICRSQEQPQCMCLDNGTNGCLPAGNGDFCGASGVKSIVNGDRFRVLTRQGVDLANKDFINYTKMASLEECHSTCEKNCTCWGAIYSNTTRNCYMMDYPIEILVEGDDSKFGYFKLKAAVDEDGDGNDKKKSEEDKLKVALLVVGCGILAAAAGFGAYQIWERRRRGRRGGSMEEGLAPGPYKDLAASSFKSIELSDSFRKP